VPQSHSGVPICPRLDDIELRRHVSPVVVNAGLLITKSAQTPPSGIGTVAHERSTPCPLGGSASDTTPALVRDGATLSVAHGTANQLHSEQDTSRRAENDGRHRKRKAEDTADKQRNACPHPLMVPSVTDADHHRHGPG
jgi:hypothetical protein